MIPFQVTKTGDTVIVHNVPIFVEHNDRGFACNLDWLKQAVENHNELKKSGNGYLPPIIIGHNKDGDPEKPAVGRFDNLTLKGNQLFADLTFPKSKYKTYVADGSFPHRSVEVFPSKHRITALALLGGTAPHFALKPMYPYAAVNSPWASSIPYAMDDNPIWVIYKSPVKNKERIAMAEKFNFEIEGDRQIMEMAGLMTYCDGDDNKHEHLPSELQEPERPATAPNPEPVKDAEPEEPGEDDDDDAEPKENAMDDDDDAEPEENAMVPVEDEPRGGDDPELHKGKETLYKKIYKNGKAYFVKYAIGRVARLGGEAHKGLLHKGESGPHVWRPAPGETVKDAPKASKKKNAANGDKLRYQIRQLQDQISALTGVTESLTFNNNVNMLGLKKQQLAKYCDELSRKGIVVDKEKTTKFMMTLNAEQIAEYKADIESRPKVKVPRGLVNYADATPVRRGDSVDEAWDNDGAYLKELGLTKEDMKLAFAHQEKSVNYSAGGGIPVFSRDVEITEAKPEDKSVKIETK